MPSYLTHCRGSKLALLHRVKERKTPSLSAQASFAPFSLKVAWSGKSLIWAHFVQGVSQRLTFVFFLASLCLYMVRHTQNRMSGFEPTSKSSCMRSNRTHLATIPSCAKQAVYIHRAERALFLYSLPLHRVGLSQCVVFRSVPSETLY